MKQAATARFLGLSQRQVYRMFHGQAEIPVAYVLLLNDHRDWRHFKFCVIDWAVSLIFFMVLLCIDVAFE